jgi:endoglycosylceramidase
VVRRSTPDRSPHGLTVSGSVVWFTAAMRDLASSAPPAPPTARRSRSRSRIAVPAAVALALVVTAVAGPAQAGGPGSPGEGISGAPAADATVRGPVGHEGRWLTDADGRVLMLTGFNLVAKGALTPDGRGFGADDADFLVANGFEAVRLGLSPDAFMPTPGQVDQDYLASYAQTVKTLTDRGLLVLVDLHQDGWGPAVCGNGFPAWMTITHGAQNTCTGFPLYYVTNPAIQAAFDSFWNNEAASDGIGLQDHVATMFGALAGAVGDDDGVLGYDILNEPWPGTVWQSCATDPAGCPVQDAEGLDELHGKVTEAIRAQDGEHLVFGEPYVLFNFGVGATNITLPGGDPDSGMSFHVYPLDPSSEPAVLANAIDWSDRTGGALITTEFGATNDTVAIRRLVGEMDQALMPWMWWSYDENVVRDLRSAPTGDNVNEEVLAALVRPHAVAVAGTPTEQTYDPDSRVLEVSWSTTAPGAGVATATPSRDTLIRVQASVYPSGYQVEVTGGRVTSPPGSSSLTVRAAPGATSVSVVVRPGSPVPSSTSTSSTSSTTSTTRPGGSVRLGAG